MAVSLTPALSQGEGEMGRAARDFHRKAETPLKSERLDLAALRFIVS